MSLSRCGIAMWVGFTMAAVAAQARAADPWVVYDGYDGPGKGKHVVLISGDEEYRSEEALPQLGKILAKRHGFNCTVLFAVDPATGTIDPNNLSNIPGLEALKTADLMILFTRFRDLPDAADAAHRRVRRGGQADPRHADGHARLQDSPPGRPTRSTTSRTSSGTADSAARSSAKPGSTITARTERRAREGSIAPGAERSPDRPRLRRHLGADGRLRRTPAACRRQPAVGAGASAFRHEADRQARRRRQERSRDAHRLDQDLPGCGGPDRPGVHDHDGLRHRLAQRRACGGCWSMPAIGASGWKTRFPLGPTWTWSADYKPSPFSFFGKSKASVKPSDHAMPR